MWFDSKLDWKIAIKKLTTLTWPSNAPFSFSPNPMIFEYYMKLLFSAFFSYINWDFSSPLLPFLFQTKKCCEYKKGYQMSRQIEQQKVNKRAKNLSYQPSISISKKSIWAGGEIKETFFGFRAGKTVRTNV